MSTPRPEPPRSQPPEPERPGSEPPRWQALDMSHLAARLGEVEVLLQQAADLAAAQEISKLAGMAELQRRLAEEQHGHPRRRRHR